jgi:alkylhydroperoxidase family enzyme
VVVAEPFDQLRATVANTAPPPPAMEPYLAKVRERAYTVTDADVDALKAAGLSEDTIFEQTVAVAIGQGLRRLDAALAVIE